MTINELKTILKELNHELRLIVNVPSIWECGGFSSEVKKSAKTADDNYLIDELYEVMNKLEDVSIILNRLSKPIEGEFILRKNSRGRYECEKHEYTCGDIIEYYCYDDYDDKFKWMRSRIEFSSDLNDYYIIHAPAGVILDGLKVRIRA